MSPQRLLSITDLKEGDRFSEEVLISEDNVNAFIKISDDTAPAHTDPEHAKEMGYKGCIVHGFMVSSGYSRVLGMFLPGGNTVIHKVQLDMLAPVYVGDTLTYEVKVTRVSPAVKTVELELKASNQDGVLVNRGKTTCVFRLN